MKKLMIGLPLVLIVAAIVGVMVWAHLPVNNPPQDMGAPTISEIRTAQSSIDKTILQEKSRQQKIGPKMKAYIISQKKGLRAAMPTELKTYQLEDEEAVSPRTIVVTYVSRKMIAPPTKSQVAGYQADYVKEISFILKAMKKAGIARPQVRSIHKNLDGKVLYRLHAGLD